jgi:hypothetical protein
MIEWSLVAGLILVLAVVFVHRVRVVQGQAELAAVRSTLGALRTALVIEHLQQSVKSGGVSVVAAQRNPFELLQRHPSNYRGEMTASDAAMGPAGSWVFDPACVCVGYLPMYAEWFDSPSGEAMAWYQLSGAPGPLQLTAKEAYVWQRQRLD